MWNGTRRETCLSPAATQLGKTTKTTTMMMITTVLRNYNHGVNKKEKLHDLWVGSGRGSVSTQSQTATDGQGRHNNPPQIMFLTSVALWVSPW